MPKDTFFNLPDEKRSTVQEAALHEFAEHGFEGASINRIVDRAGIAKGSFYQYFDDKADLFEQILDYIAELKMAFISPVLLNPAQHDFFTLLEELYRSGLAFAKENPQAARLGLEVNQNRTTPVFKQLLAESWRKADAFFRPLLELAIQRGEIDPAIDQQFVIFMIVQMQLASLDYYLEISQRNEVDEDFMPTIRLMLNFIRNGIGSRDNENHDRSKGENHS